jgi:DNA-binding response OmpR family regulator
VVLMRRAFERASLPFPLPVMHDSEEAIRYLGGRAGYHDREKFPLPTLVILDLHLPRKSGFDVIQWIRTRPELSKMPVYILTSSTDDLDQAMSMGMTDHFTKPMGFQPLVDVVRAIATRWWFTREAVAFLSRPK